MASQQDLSRRERQIMDLLFAQGESSPTQIARQLPDPPTPTAVRTMLRILMEKDLVQRRKRGREYLYQPRTNRHKAGQSALERVIRTFFGGSLDQALAAYLAGHQDQLSDEQLRDIAERIREARQRGE